MPNSNDASQALDLARKHASNGAIMQSSAEFCLRDAESSHKEGLALVTIAHAVKSLSYSVGIFHADYKAARALAKVAA
jgi:hypothetical protein